MNKRCERDAETGYICKEEDNNFSQSNQIKKGRESAGGRGGTTAEKKGQVCKWDYEGAIYLYVYISLRVCTCVYTCIYI